MTVTVCLAANALGYERGGGHLWAYLNWALGLRELNCEVIWLERRPDAPAEAVDRQLASLRRQLEPFGLAGSVVLYRAAAAAPNPEALQADLLLNLAYDLPERLVAHFPRSAMVDIDPGMTQLWLTGGQLELARHDVHFTVGEGVADGSALVDDDDRGWMHTPPCVSLAHWPRASGAGDAYTTVTHWWADEDEDWIEIGGSWLENTKRMAWEPLLELPRSTAATLELALGGVEEESELQTLRTGGWRVRDAWRVAGDPQRFRSYVAGSRGELSAAKPAYVQLQTGWFSDRSACYLASGRPAVLQWTGRSRFLPEDEGVLRFRDAEQAARALATVESDYEHHSQRARELAEEHLDARRVVGRVLAAALS
jgi:hypothetical protein